MRHDLPVLRVALSLRCQHMLFPLLCPLFPTLSFLALERSSDEYSCHHRKGYKASTTCG